MVLTGSEIMLSQSQMLSQRVKVFCSTHAMWDTTEGFWVACFLTGSRTFTIPRFRPASKALTSFICRVLQGLLRPYLHRHTLDYCPRANLKLQPPSALQWLGLHIPPQTFVHHDDLKVQNFTRTFMKILI